MIDEIDGFDRQMSLMRVHEEDASLCELVGDEIIQADTFLGRTRHIYTKTDHEDLIISFS